jgi:hypothetical protein
MPEGPVALPPPESVTGATSPAGTGLLGLTTSFATSQVAALTAFFGAVAAAYYSFQKLQTSLGISVRQCAALIGILLALLFFSCLKSAEKPGWR